MFIILIIIYLTYFHQTQIQNKSKFSIFKINFEILDVNKAIKQKLK